jgi:hypothetical protein
VGKTIKQNEKILEQNDQLLALLKKTKGIGLYQKTITKKSVINNFTLLDRKENITKRGEINDQSS